MIALIPAVDHPDVISGMSIVDTSVLPWPGATFSVSDSADAVRVERSFELLSAHVGWSRTMIATVNQVHGADIVDVRHADDIAELRRRPADGLYTTTRGILLGVKLADCCGVLTHDPVRGAIAAVHSGWRGTAANISGRMIERLLRDVGCEVKNIRAWLSPCASGSAYEVGRDVADVLGEFCTPVPDSVSQDMRQSTPKWYFDNHQAIIHQLTELGVSEGNITVDRSCTIGNTRYHSFRRDGSRSGRMLAFIGMHEKP
ncbi:MAG: hypothetical protein RIR53_1597 [Bacteroidota bacterium]